MSQEMALFISLLAVRNFLLSLLGLSCVSLTGGLAPLSGPVGLPAASRLFPSLAGPARVPHQLQRVGRRPELAGQHHGADASGVGVLISP